MAGISAGRAPTGVSIASVKYLLLVSLTTFLLLWPKYVTVGSAGARLSPYNLLVLISLGFAILAMIVPQLRGRPIGKLGWWAIGIFAAFYASRFLSDWAGTDPAGSLYSDLRDLVWIGSMFVIGVLLGNQQRSLEAVSTTVCVSVLILAVIGLVELTTQQTFPAMLLDKIHINLEPAYREMLMTDKTRDSLFRAQGVFQHPIIYGEVMAGMAPLAFARFLNGNGSRVLSLSAFFACIAGLILSGSRGGQAAFIVAMVVFVLMQVVMSRNKWVWIGTMIALPVVMLTILSLYNFMVDMAAGQTVAQRMSSQAREMMWDKGWPAFFASPMFGYGGGQSLGIAGVRGRLGALTIDDYSLTMLLDMGLVGSALLMMLFVAIALGVLFTEGAVRQRRFRSALFAGICAIATCQLATSIPEGLTFAFFLGGLLIATQHSWPTAIGRSFPTRRQPERQSA